jgi:hypothetical protein
MSTICFFPVVLALLPIGRCFILFACSVAGSQSEPFATAVAKMRLTYLHHDLRWNTRELA